MTGETTGRARKPFTEIRYKRAKDLTFTDVIRTRLGDGTRPPAWTEVLDVYVGPEGLSDLEAQYDGIPEDAKGPAARLDNTATFVVARVMVPWKCDDAELADEFLGFYAFDLVEVPSDPSFEYAVPGDDAGGL